MLETVALRPTMYTLNGSLAEVFCFLEGWYSGMGCTGSEGTRQADEEWRGFLQWAASRLSECRSGDWQDVARTLLKTSGGDAAALERMAALAADYFAERRSAAESTEAAPPAGTSSPVYGAFLFLPEHVDLSLAGAIEPLRNGLHGRLNEIEQEGPNALRLVFGNWRLRIALDDGPYVAEECREIAQMVRDRTAARQIGRCRRRLSIWSVDADSAAEHSDDHRRTVRTLLQAFPGALAWDPVSAELL